MLAFESSAVPEMKRNDYEQEGGSNDTRHPETRPVTGWKVAKIRVV